MHHCGQKDMQTGERWKKLPLAQSPTPTADRKRDNIRATGSSG